MLLVEDDQAEARELHVLGEQPVGADEDVDLAGGKVGDGLLLLLLAAEARQFGDLDRPVGKAVGEGVVVLLGQQRGRAQHGDLLAAGDGDEGGAQRDLGLAETDVAADQPVHRLARAHVGDHGIDRGHLVGCFLEAETVGEGFQVVLPEIELVALTRGALGIEMQQLGGGVANLLGGFLLRLFPLAAAELVQLHGLRIGAAVAADQMQLRHRHIKHIAAGVFEMQELALLFRRAAGGEQRQAQIAADAVLLMDHRVVDLQFGQVAQPAFEIAAPCLGALAARPRRGGVQLVFGEQREAGSGIRQDKAAGEWRDAEHETLITFDERLEITAGRGLQAIFGQVFLYRLAPTGRLGEQQRATGERIEMLS